ncbi:MAG: hypothetical protein AAF962_11850 [Actinomycetota bacterium]
MTSAAEKLWAGQNRHEGDRLRLFTAVAGAIDATDVLYPGSYVDVAPSFVFPSVVYADMDKRAARFFADVDGVAAIIAADAVDDRPRTFAFHHGDYRDGIDVPDGSVDLLVSLYAGFISEHCTRYLRVGGTLLVNPSHGDASMASIDDRYALRGVVIARSGDYRIDESNLDRFLIPRKPVELTVDHLHQLGRGIAYTTSPFAYLFRRVA